MTTGGLVRYRFIVDVELETPGDEMYASDEIRKVAEYWGKLSNPFVGVIFTDDINNTPEEEMKHIREHGAGTVSVGRMKEVE